MATKDPDNPETASPLAICIVAVLLSAFAAGAQMPAASTHSESPRRQNFLNPPAESRIIKIIHSWPDRSDAQDRLIHSLSNQNFGGVVWD